MKSSTIFALLISGVVALLTINEFWRYWIARLTPDSLPYSRRRLARRLGVSLLLLFIAAMIYFKPAELTALTELIWLSLCLAAGIIILILAIRDLHETSLIALRERNQLYSEAHKELKEVFPEVERGKTGRKKGRK